MVDALTLVTLSLAAFLAATAATMMGFGIGTILTPVFALAYRTHIAVMLVAVVHLLSNLFRLLLFRRHVDLRVIRRFGVLSILGALVGSLAQGLVQSDWLKVALGVLLIALGSIELLPGRSGWRFPRRYDRLGGLLSGLLGGFLGNQGALRGAYLVNYGLPKESFVATAALIALFIDTTRIPVYLYSQWPEVIRNWPILLAVTTAAYAGTLAGQRLVGKVSQAAFKRLVNAMIALFGIIMVAQGYWQVSGSAGATFLVTALIGAATVLILELQRRLRSATRWGDTGER